MVTIIYAHPWEGSFNKAIANRVTARLEVEGKPYQLIDLYEDGFNPAMTKEELALFGKGKTSYELTMKYQEMLKNTDEVIFIFPIWWGTLPAILKGFIDKVMLHGFAYKIDQTGWHALLNINKTTVITTSEGLTSRFEKTLGEPIFSGVFKEVGFNNVTWLNNEQTSTGTNEQRVQFLRKVEDQVV